MRRASGTMVYTHEMTHNSDGSVIYFEEGMVVVRVKDHETLRYRNVRVCGNVSRKRSRNQPNIRRIKIRPRVTIPMIPVARFSSADALATTAMVFDV